LHCAVGSEAEETVDHGSYNTMWHKEEPVFRWMKTCRFV